jgi:DNA-binding transcriptional LysR family regulator
MPIWYRIAPLMDFRHIRAFIAVADALSVTKAAERLHISQPPLSRHIQQLENELGLTLFVRHRQGVTLTEPGRQLLEKARAWEAAAETFHAAAKQARSTEGARVRVGIAWGLWDVVNRVRVEFAKDHPDVTVEASDAYCWFHSDEQLRGHQLDLAFARPPYDSSFNVSEPLYHESIQAIICADSPLATRESVSLRDLADETLLLWDRHAAPVLYDRILDLYGRNGLTPKTMPTPNAGPFNHAGMMLVASGKGMYMGYGVPQTGPTPASGVAVVPLNDADATIEVSIVSRRNDASAVAADFIACAEKLYRPDSQDRPVLVPLPRAAEGRRAS